MIQGLRTVIYQVPDLEAAKQWYARALGIEPYFVEPFYVGFEVGGFELGLDPDMGGAGPAGGVAAYWGVEDAAAELARLLALGARPFKDLAEVGEGIRVAVVKDPFGNPFGIIENPHFAREKVRYGATVAMRVISTARLDLVAATLAHVEAELTASERLADLLSAQIPASWPPGEYDRDAMEFFRGRLREGGEAVEGWYGWYAVRRAVPGEPAALVGAGGFLGPPSEDGVAELGYSVAPEHRGRGFATEMVRALVRRALESPGVRRLVAHTSRDNPASVAVLERCGFRAAAEDAGTGRVRFETPAPKLELRPATMGDLPALVELIPRSARELSRGFYTEAQTEAAIRHVFGPDTRLIADGTYFVAEEAGLLAGCGGWSRRRTLYGGDQMKAADDPLLDPATEAARIRAFFVHPGFARRGVGRAILDACLEAARAAGFTRVELASTLPGVPFYLAFGFAKREAMEVPLPGGAGLPVVRMERDLTPSDL